MDKEQGQKELQFLSKENLAQFEVFLRGVSVEMNGSLYGLQMSLGSSPFPESFLGRVQSNISTNNETKLKPTFRDFKNALMLGDPNFTGCESEEWNKSLFGFTENLWHVAIMKYHYDSDFELSEDPELFHYQFQMFIEQLHYLITSSSCSVTEEKELEELRLQMDASAWAIKSISNELGKMSKRRKMQGCQQDEAGRDVAVVSFFLKFDQRIISEKGDLFRQRLVSETKRLKKEYGDLLLKLGDEGLIQVIMKFTFHAGKMIERLKQEGRKRSDTPSKIGSLPKKKSVSYQDVIEAFYQIDTKGKTNHAICQAIRESLLERESRKGDKAKKVYSVKQIGRILKEELEKK